LLFSEALEASGLTFTKIFLGLKALDNIFKNVVLRNLTGLAQCYDLTSNVVNTTYKPSNFNGLYMQLKT